MKKEVLLVYNPNSGKMIPEEMLEKIKLKLQNRNYQTTLIKTQGKDDATKILEKAKYYDIVFSMGGDGTLNEVVNGNLVRERPLTICPLPTGSCNDVASMLGYSKDLLGNIDLALDGRKKDIDIGKINHKAFTYVAAMGKFANIPYETKRDLKRRIGYLAYIREGLKEAFKTPKIYNAEITVDNYKDLSGQYSLVMVTNSNHVAGVPSFQRNVKLDDEKFEVLLCKSRSCYDLLSSFIDFYLGNNPKNLISLKAKNMEITLHDTNEQDWCIDGEKYFENTNKFQIKNENKMKFLLPNTNQNRLFEKEI